MVDNKRTNASLWLFAAISVAIALFATTALQGVWVDASGSTGGTGGTGGTIPTDDTPTLEIINGLGLPTHLITLPSIGSSETFGISADSLPIGGADTFQVLIRHDPLVTSISSVSCQGAFDGAFSPIDAIHIQSESASAFVCFSNTVIESGTGTMIEFDVERVGFGSDQIEMLGSGAYATTFLTGGDEVVPGLPAPVDVLNLPAPTPTPVTIPSPTPTLTPAPSTGGGGGGGVPVPTATPAPALIPPGVPLDIKVEAGDQLAIIHWEAPSIVGSSPITSYTASILGGTASQILPSTGRTAVFTNVPNGIPISLRVWATNSAGNGPPSNPVVVTPYGPPGAPRSVTAQVLPGDESILVSWQEPELDNGAEIQSYTVSSAGSPFESIEVDATTFAVTLSNLTSGNYSVVVTAANAAGAGESSSPTDPVLINGPPIVSAPTEPPDGESENAIVPSIDLPSEDRATIAEAVGGSPSESVDSAQLQRTPAGIVLSLPVEFGDDSGSVTSNLAYSTTGLSLDFSSGVGTFELSMSDETVLRGAGKLLNRDRQLEVEVEEFSIIYIPLVTGDYVSTGRGIRFEVDVTDVPGLLVTTFLDSFEELDLLASPQFSIDSQRSEFGDGFREIALLAQVEILDSDSGLFGSNSVSITVETDWIENELELGRLVLMLKISDDGLVHSTEPVCSEATSGFSVCEAVFEGEAGGFSAFALLSLERMIAPTPDAITRDTQSLTATQTSPAFPATPTPVLSGAPEVPPSTETPTPFPQPVPTPVLLTPSEDGDGGGIVIVVVVAVLVGAVAAAVFVWRRRKNGVIMGMLLLMAFSAQAFIPNDTSADTVRSVSSSSNEISNSQPATSVISALGFSTTTRGIPPGGVPINMLEQSANPLYVAGTQLTGNHVLIRAATDNPDALLNELDGLGLSGATVGKDSVSGRIPLSSYGQLQGLRTDAYVTIEQPFTRSGSVVSEGDSTHRADFTRSLYGVDGTGVTVGVISDSWDCLNQYQTDVTDGELPPNVIVLEEVSSCGGAIDEGRALAQIIHDLAPGADLLFHTGFNGSDNMAEGIRELASAGADIIVDDVGYRNQPYFQDGTIGEAVNDVVDDGVIYFSSAGNQADNSYESEFKPGDPTSPGQFPSAVGAPPYLGGVPHEFTTDNLGWQQSFSLDSGDFLRLDFQWDDTFLNVNGIGAASEMDLYIFDADGDEVLAGALNLSMGYDPFESITIVYLPRPGEPNRFRGRLALVHDGGPTPSRVKFIFSTSHPDNADFDLSDEGFGAGTIYGHPNSEGAIAVGAIEYSSIPTPDRPSLFTAFPEDFSSTGGVPILRDASGNSIAPVIRSRPDILAADGVATSTDLNPFFGTSASAAHAAAVAALMVEARPGLSPDDMREIIHDTAVDNTVGNRMPGFDHVTGYGGLNVVGAMSNVALQHSGHEYDYLANGLDVTANDLVFLAVEATNGVAGNRVLALDPIRGIEVWSFDLGFVPDQVAAAEDASKVYVSEAATDRIVRIDVSGEVIDLDFSSPVFDPTISDGYQNLVVQPGNPDILAVAFGTPDTLTAETIDDSLAVFDNGVRIPPVSPDSQHGFEIVFSQDGSSLFTEKLGHVMEYIITPGPRVVLVDVFDYIPGVTRELGVNGGSLIVGNGFVMDVTDIHVVENILELPSGRNSPTQSAAVMLSPDGDRALFIGRHFGPPIELDKFRIGSLQAYDLPSAPEVLDVVPGGYTMRTGPSGYIGSMSLPFLDYDAEDLESWGTHGFALRRDSGGVFIGSTELIEDAYRVNGTVALEGIDPALAAGAINLTAIPIVGGPLSGEVTPTGTLELGVLSGIYEILASAPGFLSNSADFNAINGGGTLSHTELIAGDANSDNVIDSADALLLANSYGSSLRAPLATDESGVAADFDGDGLVTGRDASIQMKSFGMTGPINWVVSETQPETSPTPTATPTPTVALEFPVVLLPVVDGSIRDGGHLHKDDVPDDTSEGTTVEALDAPQFERRGVIEFDVSGIAGQGTTVTLDLGLFSSGPPYPFDVDVFGYTDSADGVLGLDDWDSGSLIGTFEYGGETSVSIDVTAFVLGSQAVDYIGFRFEFTVPSLIELNGPYVAFNSTEYPPAATLTLHSES